MKTYCRQGIIKDIPYLLDDSDEFQIQEIKNDTYLYPRDSIFREVLYELVDSYDRLRDLVFEDVNEYYAELKSMPIWVQEAGQSSDSSISADDFEKLIKKNNNPNLNKYLYLVDCQFLVGTIQNLIQAMEISFINYYKILAEDGESERLLKHKYPSYQENVSLSGKAAHLVSVIETYFTKAYSILDIMCKLCYEVQYGMKMCNEYTKMASAKVLWGDRKKLEINRMPSTIFEECEVTSFIETIRNEAVHNGSWELNPKIYIMSENGVIKEQYMLFPDMNQNHLATVKNRRHFFSSRIKINDVLPEIHQEFYTRLLYTLRFFNLK